MPTVALSILLGAASFAAAQVTGTFPAVPLASKAFSYPSGIIGRPYKVDTDTGLVRGTQAGYNICNSTTENQESLCQTSIINDYDDFCLWGPPEPNSTVGSVEAEMVAWCTKPGHGTRLIPAGALTGLQFLRTPDFIQLVGFIDQTKINMAPNDSGGEMDPHGADNRGNPLGGLVFSNAWNGKYQQVVEWTNFIGNHAFCLKACDPAGPNAAKYCEHIYDRLGCTYNMPNTAQNNTFEACSAESGDFPGIYTATDENGVVATRTYTQPPASLGPIATVPYTPRVPKSSECVKYESQAIFTGLPTLAVTGTGESVVPSVTGSGSTATATAKAANASSGATTLAVSGLSVFGVVFSATFLS